MKNLTKNQESIQLLAPMTKLINAILNHDFEMDALPFSMADIRNLYFFQDAQGRRYTPEIADLRLGQIEADLAKVNLLLDSDPDNTDLLYREFCLEVELQEQHSFEYERKQISEWWLVNSDFGKYLLLLKQPMLIHEGNYFWGITLE
ncbi:hypothetical protein QT327_16705 [Olivibacter sp. 47]|jgi:hypothetical protein|uniref:hypothetical protein n=1 Tax=Olivibacter sp. 47 TaxID=3056486 RepID=UPI0025A405E1|nr:hypothetical protein [Olivibacter sp. 47]MDM8175968.1 hypothetical protein [Olivibacter sp. 47]